MPAFRVRAADVARLDWDALRGVRTLIHLDEVLVHIEWDWLTCNGKTRTDPRREPAVAV